MAFLEHGTSTIKSLGRRHLITLAQFDDLIAQESRRPSSPMPIDDLEPGRHHLVGHGNYDNLIALDPVDGIPVVTFTAPSPPETREATPPSPAYLGTIVRGLADAHPLTDREIAERVLLSPGVAPHWHTDAIVDLMTDPAPQ